MNAAVCVLGLISVLLAGTESQPVVGSSTDDMQKSVRRYAESTIASDISKIMDSMIQKNFVNFLLKQREKKSEPTNGPEQIFCDLLRKKLMMLGHCRDTLRNAERALERRLNPI